MNLFLFLALSSFGFVALADISVNSGSGKILLQAKACEEITPLVQEFPNPQCGKKISSGWFAKTCDYEITLCLSDIFRELHGLKALVNGLNSWNLALFSSGVVPVLRHSSADEFKFYLKSPLCHPLKEKENHQMKDIIVVRDREGDEIHSFLYVTESLVFSKNSSKTLDPYLLQKRTEITDMYRINAEENHFEYFRCEGMEKYLHRIKNLPAELLEAHRNLNVIEKTIAHVLPVKVTINEVEAQELKIKIEKAIAIYKAFGKRKESNLDLQFVEAAIRQRLMGVSEHFKSNAKSVTPSEVEIKKPLIEIIDTAFEPAGAGVQSAKTAPEKRRKNKK